jgi:hypothetical protein
MSSAFEPELAQVTSNNLEATVRNLLPSVSGFGSRLGAQNVIVPIIDLTPTAEGSVLPVQLQTAWDHATDFVYLGSATTETLTTTPGFWQVDLNSIVNTATGGITNIQLTDGSTAATLWEIRTGLGSGGDLNSEQKFVVYVKLGTTLQVTSTTTAHATSIWYRQIADSNGNLIDPDGYTSL